jgi:2-aminoethylphosphonate-pyruvate transaminase
VTLIVDAMGSLGALPIDACATPFDVLISASGKCLDGVPGMDSLALRLTANSGAWSCRVVQARGLAAWSKIKR